MVRKKTTLAGKPAIPPSFNFPLRLQWIFAVLSMIIVPVIYYESAIDQVLMPRFTGISLVLLLFYAIFSGRSKYKLPETGLLKRAAVISWMLFALISILSLFVAVNPVEGSFGIFKIIVFLLFLIAASSIYMQSENTKPFTTSVAILALIYLLVGYYQYFSFSFGHKDISFLYKVIGIWTHKNFFSGMLYLVIPLIAYNILSSTKNRIVFTILLFLIFTLLFLLQTRSVWLAILLFLFSAKLLLFIFRKSIFTENRKSLLFRGIFMIAVSLVLSVLIAWLLTGISLDSKTRSTVNNSKTQEKNLRNIDQRVASMFSTRESNTRQRLDMWKMSFKMISDHPVMGVGTGNWKIVIPDYFEKEYNAKYFNNIRRPHNDLIWILCENGIFGLLAYLGFFLFLLIYSIKLLKKEIEPFKKVLVIICLSALVGYFADSMLSFPYERIEHQVMVMFYAAVILGIYSLNFPLKSKVKSFNPLFLTIPAISFLIVAVIFGRLWIVEEVCLNKAFSAHLQKDWTKTIRLVDKISLPVALLDPRNTPVLWYRGKAYLQLNDDIKAREDLEEAYRQNPNSILVLIDLGVVYGKKGEYDKAIELFKKSLKIYPKYEDGLINLGTAYYLTSNYREAISCLEQVIKTGPNPEVERMIKFMKQKMK